MKLTRTLTLLGSLALAPLVMAAPATPNDMLKQKIQSTLGLEVNSITADRKSVV